jgi:hypothetical protein
MTFIGTKTKKPGEPPGIRVLAGFNVAAIGGKFHGTTIV